MALFSKRNKALPPAHAASIVAEKKAALDAARAKLESATRTFDDAVYFESIPENQGRFFTTFDGEQIDSATADQGVKAAEYYLRQAEAAYRAAERIHGEAMAQAKADAENAAWADLDALDAKALALARSISKDQLALAKKIQELDSISTTMFNLAPRKEINAVTSSPFASGKLVEYFKLGLTAAGLGRFGGKAWFGHEKECPTVTDLVAERSAWIKKMRPGQDAAHGESDAG